ncbi:MAG: hypothetical protein IH849_00390 [Acidobacteria bacterium]|nr:hypothetical protein [Acidobacteriota bacterium]
MATARTAGLYRPRRPERTVLYRVLAQHFERFVQVYDERFAPTHGPLTRGAQEAVYRYLDRGIFANGFAIHPPPSPDFEPRCRRSPVHLGLRLHARP